MLTAKDGLLDDFVGSMIVDKAGSVWFGHPLDERGGATRYDGKAFTHFTEKEGLPSKNVYCMLEDRDGRIWFGGAVIDRRGTGEQMNWFAWDVEQNLPATAGG